MSLPLVYKKVAEKFEVGFYFSPPDLASGETISTCTAAVLPTGLTLTGSCVISGSQVTQIISGGTAGVEYVLTFTITTSAGRIFTPDLQVRVN
jgi:hypothetical protein